MLRDYGKTVEKIEKLIDRQDHQSVRLLLSDLYSEDVAYIASHIDEDYRESFLQEIKSLPDLSEILPELSDESIVDLVGSLKEHQIAPLFSRLDPDNSAKVIATLPESMADWLLSNMATEDSEEAATLLQYSDEVAGRIMTTEFFSVHEDKTVFEAFNALKESKESHEAELIYYVYVVDDYRHLIGVASLRDLLTTPNHVAMKDIMKTGIISIPVTMDQEKVASVVERYNLMAVPVVDDKNRLVGIVTVDDVIDVIRSEATEDIMKLAGTTEEEFSLQSPYKGFIRRMPWLLVSFFGGMLTIQSNLFFSKQISQMELMAFVTIIAGMGGNIASQSSTIVVRGLATGRIMAAELWEVLFKEVSIGILLGIFFGLLLGIVSAFQFRDFSAIGISVGVGMLSSMIIAATIGSLMPIVFQRLHIDPAVATGPFVSTTIDNLGLLSYFGTTILILRMLGNF